MLNMGSFELRRNPNLEVTKESGIIQTYNTEHRHRHGCLTTACMLTTAANVSDRIMRGL